MGSIDPNTEQGWNALLDMLTTMQDPTKTFGERYGPFMDEVVENMQKLKADLDAGRLLTAAVKARQYGQGLSGLAVLLVRALGEAERAEADAEARARSNIPQS